MSFEDNSQTMQYLQQHQPQMQIYPNPFVYQWSYVNCMNNNWNQQTQNAPTTYKYMTTKLIGSGTFGEIWNVIDQNQGQYAIKMIKNGRKKYEQIFVNEGKRILKLNKISTSEVGKHLIIKCKELLFCTNAILNLFSQSALIGPCIVMELCGYSLAQYMQFNESTNSEISLSTIRCISAQIFFAMSFLHGIGACIHSDLKPENILIKYSDCYQNILSKSPSIKIIDFGNAIDIEKNEKLKSFNIQSLWYRSPEVLLGNYKEISSLIDMWSIGCILFELTSLNNGNKKKKLFKSQKLNAADIVNKISEKLSSFPQYVYNDEKSFHYFRFNAHMVSHISNESSYIKLKNQRKLQLIKNLDNNNKEEEFQYLIDLLSCLLDLNPLTRYTSEDAIRHKFTVYNYENNDCIQHKIHPIIKSCDDNQRQQRINLQINEYQNCNLSVYEANKNSDSFPITIVKQHL